MGLLGLFSKDFAALRKRGDKAFDRQEWAVARNEYAQALQRYKGDDPAGHAHVEQRLAAAAQQLVQMHERNGEAELEAGFAGDALEHFKLAADLTQDAEGKKKLMARMEAILAEEENRLANAEEMALEEQDAVEDAFHAHDPDERFALLVEQLPEDVRDAYLEEGPEFRQAYLTLHEGGEENAQKALEMLEALRDGSQVEGEEGDETGAEENDDGEEGDETGGEQEGESDAEEIGLQPLVELERGRALLVLGRFQEAADALMTYCEHQPEDVMGLRMLAEALDEVERYDEAVEILHDIAVLAPEDPRTYVQLGEHHLRTETYADGVDALRAGLGRISIPTRQVPLFRTLGQVYMAAEEDDSAIQAFEQAIEAEWEVDNETGELFFDRPSAWWITGLYAKAGEELDRALDLVLALERGGHDEERWQLLTRKGDILKQLGETEEAREALLRAHSLAPEGADGIERIDKLIAEL